MIHVLTIVRYKGKSVILWYRKYLGSLVFKPIYSVLSAKYATIIPLLTPVEG